jgi:hypothetical protein
MFEVILAPLTEYSVIHPQFMPGIANSMQVNQLIGMKNLEFVCHRRVLACYYFHKRCCLIFLRRRRPTSTVRKTCITCRISLFLFCQFGVHKNLQLQPVFGSIRNIQEFHKQAESLQQRWSAIIFCIQKNFFSCLMLQ